MGDGEGLFLSHPFAGEFLPAEPFFPGASFSGPALLLPALTEILPESVKRLARPARLSAISFLKILKLTPTLTMPAPPKMVRDHLISPGEPAVGGPLDDAAPSHPALELAPLVLLRATLRATWSLREERLRAICLSNC